MSLCSGVGGGGAGVVSTSPKVLICRKSEKIIWKLGEIPKYLGKIPENPGENGALSLQNGGILGNVSHLTVSDKEFGLINYDFQHFRFKHYYGLFDRKRQWKRRHSLACCSTERMCFVLWKSNTSVIAVACNWLRIVWRDIEIPHLTF